MATAGTGPSGRGGGGRLPDGMPGPMDMGGYHHHQRQQHQLHQNHIHQVSQTQTHTTHSHHPLAQQQQQTPQYGQHSHGAIHIPTSGAAAAAANAIRGRLASSAGLEDLIASGASSSGPSASAAAAAVMRRHSLAVSSVSISSPISPLSGPDLGNGGMMNGIQVSNPMASSPRVPTTGGIPMPVPSTPNLLLQQGMQLPPSTNSNNSNLNTLLQMPISMPVNVPPNGHGHGHGHGSKPIRRRMRMITSCLECRRRKLKCNKSQPCTNCIKFSRECLYLGPKLDEASQLRLTEIKEKVGSLERQLERDVAKGSTSSSTGSSLAAAGIAMRNGGGGLPQQYVPAQEMSSASNPRPYQHQSQNQQQQRIVADELDDDLDTEDLEITPMVALDLTYEDDADGTMPTDDLIDLGIQVGRMRITERIGGLNRPRISEEIQAGLGQGPQIGSSPTFNMAPQPSSSSSSNNNSSNNTNHNNNSSIPSSSSSDIEIPAFLRPGTSYIPPTSGYFFGQVVESPSLLNFLPGQTTGDKLIMRYFEAVHPIARCVHRPSFEPIYASFWDEVNQGIEPRASVQALVFAAWFSAAVSLRDDSDAAQVAGMNGAGLYFSRFQLIENMKVGTEAALSKANFLRTTKVETMQAFVMYMLPLCRDEVSRAHSVLVGAAVRMAECMGLHRDGQAYGLDPLETQVRRLIWHQLCFLDIRTCEAQGPKPGIRRDDYDTTLPLNVEEDELANMTWSSVPPSAASSSPEKWTSNLLSIIRFEINEMMRIIWSDRRKIEIAPGRKTNLAAVLVKIESFRKRMLEKYEHLLDDKVPIQLYTKLVMNLLMYRLRAMVLHPYHTNTSNPMPDRLTSVLLMSGVMIIEISMHLEKHPVFNTQWGWYTGAYQQYQMALLLATEIYYRPDGAPSNDAENGDGSGDTGRLVDRIWGCLDYVFDLDPSMDRSQKSYLILSEIMSKTGVYMSMRKMRAPVAILRAVPEREAVKTSSADSPGQPQDMLMGKGQGGSPPPGSGSSSTSGGSTIRPDNPNLKVEPGLAELAVPPPSREMDLDNATGSVSSSSSLYTTVGSSAMLNGLSGHQQHHQNQLNHDQHQHHLHHHQMSGGHFGQTQPQGLPPNMTSMMMMPPSVGIGPLGGQQSPFSNMVFAGVSNGEVLWGLPPGSHHHHHNSSSSSNGNNPGSPNSSDGGGSVVGHHLSMTHHHQGQAHNQHQQHVQHGAGGGVNGNGNMNGLPLSHGSGMMNGNAMKDIDWETINMLFPADPQTGDFNFNMFVPDPSLNVGVMHQNQSQEQHPGQQRQGQQSQHQHQQQQNTANSSSTSPTCASSGIATPTNGVGKWVR